jgi:predicted RNA-binding Zn-ribbon protein involved in translation (DUF1610 family)
MIAVKTLCEREGVPFKLVPAQYTSVACPKCGYRDEKNRSGEWFKCLKCGYQTDADLAGAMNISLRALDGTADGAVNDVRHASRLKPKRLYASEAGQVARPKAAMRDVPLERAATSGAELQKTLRKATTLTVSSLQYAKKCNMPDVPQAAEEKAETLRRKKRGGRLKPKGGFKGLMAPVG